MKRKLIISENQYKRLTELLTEAEYHEVMVKEIAADLTANYDRAHETFESGNDYSKRRVFQNKVDEEPITPHNLLEYLKGKYDVNEEFLKQVMNDWFDGKIKDNKLSKNVGVR